MTPTTSTTSTWTLRGRLGAATVAAGLLATAVATPTLPAHAAPTALDLPGNCDLVTHDGSSFVECMITDSGTVSYDDLVAQHLAPLDGAPVVLTARGGDGATLDEHRQGRSGGTGGTARTVANAEDVDRLHLFVGRDAAMGSREGGSSTVVSPVPISDVADIDDTWLVAGGGGAQGAAMDCGGNSWGIAWQGAGSGGEGGAADATRTDGDATGAGRNGGPGSTTDCPSRRTGHPGTGGDRGVAGTNHGDPRSNGIDGVGGLGGDNGWQGDVAPDHLPGRGGVTSVYAMGGGGWGGGGGGERNGGGGGGGSYARAATGSTSLPDIDPSSPSVTIAWPLPVSTLVADTDGDGTITVARPDGTVLCDDVTRCEASVEIGDDLVITATPDPIADFSGFDGDCDVDATTCTTTHQPGHHVTATFHTPTVPITINVNFDDAWATTGWVTHDGETVCGYGTPDNRCTVQVPERAPATLRSGSQQNTAFSHWSGPCTGTGPTCTIDPAGSPTVTASFTHSDSGW